MSKCRLSAKISVVQMFKMVSSEANVATIGATTTSSSRVYIWPQDMQFCIKTSTEQIKERLLDDNLENGS